MDEQLKQSAMIAIIAMAITVIIYQIIFTSGMFGEPIQTGTFIFRFLLGIVIGAVVGGVVFGAMQMLNKR